MLFFALHVNWYGVFVFSFRDIMTVSCMQITGKCTELYLSINKVKLQQIAVSISLLVLSLLVLKSGILFFREKPVKAHLQNVYGAMAVALLACATGGYLHLFTDFMIVCISNFFCYCSSLHINHSIYVYIPAYLYVCYVLVCMNSYTCAFCVWWLFKRMLV